MKNSISLQLRKLAVLMLVAVMAFTFTACSKEDSSGEVTDAADTAEGETSVVGEGEASFLFDVKFEDGTMNSYEVKTDATIVGEALVDAGLIEGEESEYGLYVKTVDGVTLDYDTDGAYWGFFIDGEMAATGVDQTELVEGATYSFEYAK